MKMKNLLASANSLACKAGFSLKKHSPEILIITGVVGTVVSAVMACKATTKISVILDETKETVESVHNCLADEKMADKYTLEDSKKDLALIYVKTGVKLVKLYAPSIALGALSIGGILASNNILRKRNVALAAAYAAVDKSFKEYSGRVIERFGEEVDRELRYNIKANKFEKTVTDENGKEKKVKETVKVADLPDGPNEYARFFDESSSCWEGNAEYNLVFLRAQQNYANDLLRTRGHLFLNEVYDMLDIPRTTAGQCVGWLFDPKNNEKGDNYVDFGMYETNRKKTRDFVNGYEPAILLNFNVDGPIMNLI